ncbi:hypothetical protein ACOTVF_08485 [Campylobacter jejuni]|uniref:hypothetical protein n=1 Tax=Campylobacter jejuni TaxID=197 RepID=UPI003BA0A74C
MMKIILANRTDGMGSRIMAILNALYISDRFKNYSVKIYWESNRFHKDNSENINFRGDEKSRIIGMSVEYKENIFDLNFLNKYFIDKLPEKNLIIDLDDKNLTLDKNIIQFEKSEKECLEVDIYEFNNKFSDVDENEYRDSCAFLWSTIGFKSNLKSIMKYAEQCANRLDNFFSVHVRTGDAIYGYSNVRKFHLTSMYHATNAALAYEIINMNLGTNYSIVIIGDDVDTNETIVSLFNDKKVININSIRKFEKFSNLELLLFDIVFMSKSKKIYGTNSAVVKIAKLISSAEFFNNYEIFNDEDYYEILKSNYRLLCSRINCYQNAFILFHLFWIGVKVKEKCGILCQYLDNALEYDYDNDKYRIYKMYCLLTNDRIDEAEVYLKKVVMERQEKFINLLFSSNWAGSFSIVFIFFIQNANSKYPYISFIAAKICEYQHKFYDAIKFINLCLHMDIDDKKILNLEYNFNSILIKYVNELEKKNQFTEKELFTLQTQISNLIQENQVLQNKFQNELNSIPIKKQNLEIKNLEQDLVIKKLKSKKLAKSLGVNMSIINPKISFIQTNSVKSRIQNQLSYKLGQTLILNSKSVLGYLSLPFIILSIVISHKQEQKAYKFKVKKNPNLALPPLETYPDYNEALKEKECFTYKLGEAFIKASKNWYKGGYIKFILKDVPRLKREFGKEN